MADDQLNPVERVVLDGLRRADPDAAASLASLDPPAQRRVLEQFNDPSAPEPSGREADAPQPEARPEPGSPEPGDPPTPENTPAPKRRSPSHKWAIASSVLIATAVLILILYGQTDGIGRTDQPAAVGNKDASTGTSPATTTLPATTVARVASLGDCHVGMQVRPGQSCRHPMNSEDFIVNADGTGSFGFGTTGRGININSFRASRQSNDAWLILRVKRTTAPPAPTTVRSSNSTTTAQPPTTISRGDPVTAEVTDCTGTEQIDPLYSAELTVLVRALREVTGLWVAADSAILGREHIGHLEQNESQEVVFTGPIVNPTDADCEVTITWDD